MQEDISSTASIFALKSVGSLAGTLVTGLLLDRCRPSAGFLFSAIVYLLMR